MQTRLVKITPKGVRRSLHKKLGALGLYQRFTNNRLSKDKRLASIASATCLAKAFMWGGSPEGSDFWLDVVLNKLY